MQAEAKLPVKGKSTLQAPESITFLCTDVGTSWSFYAAGTLFQLPNTLHGAARLYIPFAKSVYHGTPQVVSASGHVEVHGNAASALVSRCVLPSTRDPSLRCCALHHLAGTAWCGAACPSHFSLSPAVRCVAVHKPSCMPPL